MVKDSQYMIKQTFISVRYRKIIFYGVIIENNSENLNGDCINQYKMQSIELKILTTKVFTFNYICAIINMAQLEMKASL